MLVHRMAKKVKDSKVLAKVGDSRGYKVKDQIIKGFMIYKSGTNQFTAKNEKGKRFEGTMEQINKQINDYWTKQDEDVMKQKVKDEMGKCKSCGDYKHIDEQGICDKCKKDWHVEGAHDSKTKVRDEFKLLNDNEVTNQDYINWYKQKYNSSNYKKYSALKEFVIRFGGVKNDYDSMARSLGIPITDSKIKVKDSIKSRFNFKKTKDVIPSDEEIGKLVSEVLSQKKEKKKKSKDSFPFRIKRSIIKRFRARVRDAFKETEHPRGQPDNKGQFVAKGEESSYSKEETAIANKTSRAMGAVGNKAVTPAYVSKIAKPSDSILDFGAGKAAAHAKTLKEKGLNVTAYEFGENAIEGLHDKNALKKKYDIVYASNVLNVQSSEAMLRKTLEQIKSVSDGKVIFNYPASPRKSDMSAKDVASIIEEVFGAKPKLVGGSASVPLWEVQSIPNKEEPSNIKQFPTVYETAVKDSIKSRFNFKKTKDEDLKSKIIAFFKANPNSDDEKIHAFAEEQGINPHELETNIYALLSERLTNDAMSKEEAIKAFKELEDKRDKAKKAGNQSEAARLDKEIDALFNREAGFKDGVFTSEGVPLNIAYKYGRWDAESGKSKEEHPFKIGSPQHNEWLKGYEFEKRFKSKDFEIRDVIELKKSDAPDDQFDAEQLAMGIEVEKEHTDNPEIAKAIAKAHLSEIKDYYTRLAKMESEAKTTDKKVKDADYYCPKCNALMNTKVEAMAAEAKGTKDEKRIIAKWEAKGGKQYINLYDDGTYHSNNGGGNTGKTGNEAIQYMENNTVKYFKMDYPSVKRVI